MLAVCLIVCGAFAIDYFNRFSPSSTGEHIIANKLKDNISYLPYLQNGSIYYYKDGASIAVAENVYDASSETPLYTADYGINGSTGQMVYVSEDRLFYFDGASSKLIASNITAWRTSQSMQAIAFTVSSAGKESTIGTLFLYYQNKIIPLDSDVLVSTLKFSQDGTVLFAQKSNSYPKIRTTLYKYDLNGNKTVLDNNCMPLMWVSDSGDSAITGESDDDSLYSYRVFAENFTKEKTFKNVYYSNVTQDKSILYLLCDYNYDTRQGRLVAVDLKNLKEKELAKDVSFMSLEGVTDASKGVLYSVCTDGEKGYYSVYYCDISGTSTRLVRNTSEETLYSVAIDTQRNNGYILSQGSTVYESAVYYIEWKNGSLSVENITTGYVDGLVYYEHLNAVTFGKNFADGICQLYYADSSLACRMLTADCGAEYSSSSQRYTTVSVLSNTSNEVMYFNNIVTGETTVDTVGTLKLCKNGECITVDENVSSRYMEAPVANGNMSQIYYLKENEDETMDLYLFENSSSTLITKDVHGIIETK